MEYIMNNVPNNPVIKSQMVSKPASSNAAVEKLFADIFTEAATIYLNNPLASSEALGQFIDNLDAKRTKVNGSQRFALQGLHRILKDCAVLEAKLREFGLIGSRSPKQFLQQINATINPELTLPMLMVKKQVVKESLQAVIENAEHREQVKNKTDAELTAFTNKLKKLIENNENYMFIDETNGFFCREVLIAYRKHLEASYDDVLFKGEEEIFTVESIQ